MPGDLFTFDTLEFATEIKKKLLFLCVSMPPW
jgi:hypothetical protein